MKTATVVICIFAVLGLPGAANYLVRGDIDPAAAVLAILVECSFLFIAYLLLKAYSISRRKVFIALFIALFVWPLILTSIQFSISYARGLPKKGVETRIGGFGDLAGAMLMLDDLALGASDIHLGLALMLGTNLVILIPTMMLLSEAKAAQQP